MGLSGNRYNCHVPGARWPGMTLRKQDSLCKSQLLPPLSASQKNLGREKRRDDLGSVHMHLQMKLWKLLVRFILVIKL